MIRQRNEFVEPVVEVRTRPSRALTIMTCMAPLLGIILLCVAFFTPLWRTTYADENHVLVDSKPQAGYLYTFGLFTFTVQGINRPAHLDCGSIAHRILLNDDGCALHRDDTECHCWYPNTVEGLTSPLWDKYAPGFPALHQCRNPRASAAAFNHWRTLGRVGFISSLVILCLGFVFSFGLLVCPRRRLVHVLVCLSLLVLIFAVCGFVGTYIITLNWSNVCSIEREVEEKYDYPGPSLWVALASFGPLAVFMISACFLLVVIRRLEILADPVRTTLLVVPGHTFV